MSKPNLTENVYSQARKKQLDEIKAAADAVEVGALARRTQASVIYVKLHFKYILEMHLNFKYRK